MALGLLVAALVLILLGVFFAKWFLFVGIAVAIVGAALYFFGGSRYGGRVRR